MKYIIPKIINYSTINIVFTIAIVKYHKENLKSNYLNK